jgi:hypothetical protein
LRVKVFSDSLLLDTRLGPSGGCVLILPRDLKLRASLCGWLLGQLGSDLWIYHRSEVHFAPVHPAEIAVYNLSNKHDVTIFPLKGATAIRQARIAQRRDFYETHEKWCQENNDPCDPEQFDSGLESGLVTDDREKSIAFVISYGQIQAFQGDQKPPGPREVLYIFRHADDDNKMEYREMLWSDVKTQFGDVPLQDLVQPEMLQKIFGESPPKNPKH